MFDISLCRLRSPTGERRQWLVRLQDTSLGNCHLFTALLIFTETFIFLSFILGNFSCISFEFSEINWAAFALFKVLVLWHKLVRLHKRQHSLYNQTCQWEIISWPAAGCILSACMVKLYVCTFAVKFAEFNLFGCFWLLYTLCIQSQFLHCYVSFSMIEARIDSYTSFKIVCMSTWECILISKLHMT